MPPRISLLLLLMCSIAPLATAQTVRIEATIRDAASGEPLPGATVQVEDTDIGGAADAAGRVRLPEVQLPVRLRARYLGYREERLIVEEGAGAPEGVIRLEMALHPDIFGLGEVEVLGERLAEGIMRRVLERKAALSEQIGRYSMEAYTRLVLERHARFEVEPTPVRWTEVLSDVHWQRGGDTREAVVARIRTPAGGPFRYADVEPVPDFFFANYVALDGHLIPTPTHPEAFSLYAFHAGDVIVANGRRYIDIAVAPRQRGLFAGRLRVADSLYVLAEAELRVPDHRGDGGFVQDWQASYHVTFSPARDSLWLPERFVRTGEVQVGTTGAELPRVLFRQETRLSRRAPALGGPAHLWSWPERYYGPAGVYEGQEVFDRYRGEWPITEDQAAAIDDLRGRDLSRLLFRQGMLAAYVRLPIYGRDSPAR